MNKDQIEGTVKAVAGKVQKKIGEAVGSDTQRTKGVVNEASGKIQRVIGDAKKMLKDANVKS